MKNENVTPLDLRRYAKSIASNYGDEGAIVISVGKEGTRIGTDGLSFDQIQDALCLAINYNFSFSEETPETLTPNPKDPV